MSVFEPAPCAPAELFVNGEPVSDTNPLPVAADLEASDIQIGAVEIKDGSTNQRAAVNGDGELLTADSGVGEVGDAAVITDAAGTLSGKLRGLVKWAFERMPAALGQTTKALSLPVTLPSDQDMGFLAQVEAEFARPADTNAYAALDAVSNSVGAPAVLTFPGAVRVAAGSGYITKARLMTDLKTATARLRLHLFIAAPAAIADNAPYTLLYSNRANRIGRIDFPALATEDPANSTAAAAQVADVRLPFKLAAGVDLFGMLETLDAIAAPASAQNFYVQLTVDQN